MPDGALAHRNVAHRQQHAIVGELRLSPLDQRRREVAVTREPPAAGRVDGDAVHIAIA